MANPRSVFSIPQKILPDHEEEITATSVHEDHLSQVVLDQFLRSVVDGKIGLAPTYDSQQVLVSIAFASQNQVLIVKLSANSRFATQKRDLLNKMIFLNSSFQKYAFHMDKLSTSLFYDFSLRIVEAVDILSGSPERRHLLKTKVLMLGGEPKVDSRSVIQLFREEESFRTGRSVVALQAWAAYQAALELPYFVIPCSIDTTIFSGDELKFLAKTIRDAEQLRGLKPLVVRNEIEDECEFGDKLTVRSSRYKTRIMRPGSNQVSVEMTRDGQTSKFAGRLSHLQGRMAQLDVSGVSHAESVSICTMGREDPTTAEALRGNILLRVMQDIDAFLALPFVRDIWFPEKDEGPLANTFSEPIPFAFSDQPLNGSQKSAVEAILSNKPSKRVVLIQGPPGTGKTTVISTAVINIMASRDTERNVWLVAQSNVAVKNIAEKLASLGFFDFKLLVSKEFHFDWYLLTFNIPIACCLT
ncbi:hypothetical protein P691DRAFT_662219 [Macrolepiota fuliginosa MF-IS2]|uniref:DNA2/NAM7 helicase helicase domain-containing protein n=1 Tax=Macrolepiota fuliginosa MF-IS2 TaxID=1400762 RepID=A0A9P5XJJ7_9AGAR|nr:hypothetical protein P691DRAFT_662219 [Macrolepiota fuliginosa MF-IS2]